MSEAVTPPGPDEILLRRIVIGPGYYDPDAKPPVGKGAFTPGKDDTDGLSFYLEGAVSAAQVSRSAASGRVCKVAGFRASEIYGLGLSLTPDQQLGDLPGHHLVREINLATYKSKDLDLRKRTNELCIELARMAESRLMHLDDGPPVESKP